MAHAVIVVATFNRAALLADTLESIAHVRVAPSLRWELIVVDNNSTDDTARVVERRIAAFPAPLRYVFESRQGRSAALNAGIAASSAPIVVFTDDDVCVSEDWLQSIADALGRDPSVDYVGGPVRPIWEAPCPPWLDRDRGDLWGTIAIQDHGAESFVYEERQLVPLGANMAARRSLIDRIGGFCPTLGRSNRRCILGQEVPEWLARARAVGARGRYVPAMELHHHVPAARVTKRYFRRWWWGKGVSRARLDQMQPITELGVDLRTVPYVAGIPRFMLGTAARDLAGYLRALTGRDPRARFRHAASLTLFCGYAWARWIAPGARRGTGAQEAPHPHVQPRASAVPATYTGTSVQRTSNVTTTGRWSDGM